MKCSFIYLLLSMPFVFLCMSCDQDPLRNSYRKVAGIYYLYRWEDGKTYYIEEKGAEKQYGGGILDGIVEQIGWNNSYIIAKRRATFGGDPDGWMVLDVNKKSIKGPFNNEVIKKMPEANGMRFWDPAKAWEELR